MASHLDSRWGRFSCTRWNIEYDVPAVICVHATAHFQQFPWYQLLLPMLHEGGDLTNFLLMHIQLLLLHLYLHLSLNNYRPPENASSIKCIRLEKDVR
jgi:hypothetical protein